MAALEKMGIRFAQFTNFYRMNGALLEMFADEPYSLRPFVSTSNSSQHEVASPKSITKKRIGLCFAIEGICSDRVPV